MKLVRTDSTNPDFQTLVALLDAELAFLDGDQHEFYAQFNKTGNLRHTLVAYVDGEPAGIGAIKPFSTEAAEVKRMYVKPAFRRAGIAAQIVAALEQWARELGYRTCVLETGKRQPEAIALYLKLGFAITENYGQYVGIENSVCFRKDLSK